jgi:hypothetical protein
MVYLSVFCDYLMDSHSKLRGGSSDNTISFGRGRRDRPVRREMIDDPSLGLQLSARIARRLSRGRDEMTISGDFGKVESFQLPEYLE